MNQNISPLTQEVFAGILAALYGNGVTDVVGEKPVPLTEWKNAAVERPSVPSVAPQKPAMPQPVAAKGRPVTPKKPVQAVPTKPIEVKVEGESTALTLLLTDDDMLPEELELMNKMLAAIGQKPGIRRVVLPAGVMPQLAQQTIKELDGTIAFLAFGSSAIVGVTGQVKTLRELRETPENIEGIPAYTTYAPRTLLAQPVLKRLAWQDLLKLKEKIEKTNG